MSLNVTVHLDRVEGKDTENHIDLTLCCPNERISVGESSPPGRKAFWNKDSTEDQQIEEKGEDAPLHQKAYYQSSTKNMIVFTHTTSSKAFYRLWGADPLVSWKYAVG